MLTTIRVSSSALKENSSAPIAEWSIHHIGMTSDPAEVSNTCKDFSSLIVKYTLYNYMDSYKTLTEYLVYKLH